MESLKNRLLAKIETDTETGCWNWTAAKTTAGYGQIRFEGRLNYAHRASFEIHREPIPIGMFVCHRCDNRACINPAHLFLGTGAENIADMVAKGRNVVLRGIHQNGAKLTESDVMAIRSADGVTQQKLASQFGVSQSLIWCIRSGRNWTHLI